MWALFLRHVGPRGAVGLGVARGARSGRCSKGAPWGAHRLTHRGGLLSIRLYNKSKEPVGGCEPFRRGIGTLLPGGGANLRTPAPPPPRGVNFLLGGSDLPP